MKCIFCKIYGNIYEHRKEIKAKNNNKEVIKIRIERFKTLAQITASLVVVLSLFSSFYKLDFIKHLNIDSHAINNNINWIIILTFFLWFVLLAVGVKIALLYDKLADLEFNESKKTIA
jgi:hypothetical protein|nr:MAG TPA: hypothetical protein [Caudoviricetes sp.]